MDWRIPGSNLRPLVYRASDITTAPRRLLEEIKQKLFETPDCNHPCPLKYDLCPSLHLKKKAKNLRSTTRVSRGGSRISEEGVQMNKSFPKITDILKFPMKMKYFCVRRWGGIQANVPLEHPLNPPQVSFGC